MTTSSYLDTLLGDWRKLLTDWSISGALTKAAQDALLLEGTPKPLRKLVQQWSNGDFLGLPPIVLLPSSSMPGAAGAYAISTGTIYLNEDWLKTASHDWVIAVLTEELGHHLDGMLNTVDTPGDEGESFSAYLTNYSHSSLSNELEYGTISPSSGIFLKAEYAGAPTTEWLQTIQTTSNATVLDVAVTLDGGIAVVGTTDGNYDGQLVQPGFTTDGFVIKYAGNGLRLWTRYLGTTGRDEAKSVVAASDGGIIVVGSTGGNLDGATNNGGIDSFVTKFSATGDKSWTVMIGTASFDEANSVALTLDGGFLVAGQTYGSLHGQLSKGGSDGYLSRFDSNGARIWTTAIGGAYNDVLSSVFSSTSSLVAVAGYTRNGIDGQVFQGQTDGLVSLVNSSGTRLWTRLIGTPSYDYINSVAIASDGGVIVVGSTEGNLDGLGFQGSPGAFAAKYDANGSKLWSKLLGYQGGNCNATSVVPTTDGGCIISGQGGILTAPDGQTYIASGYVSRLDANGSLVWSQSIGDPSTDFINSITSDGADNIIAAGRSNSVSGKSYGLVAKLSALTSPIASINSVTVVEGSAASTVANLTVTLSAASTQNVTVQYATTDGTAKAGTDYTATTGTLTIAAGQTTGTISIPIVNNNINEAVEKFTVTLSNPVNATIATGTGTVTISDTLQSSTMTTLAAGVENLTLTGTALADGTGNAGPNILIGNTNNNILNGLAGNDTYSFTANTLIGSDRIVEAVGGGTDGISFSATTSAIRVNLGTTATQSINANLKLTLSAGNVIENVTGGTSNDTITGNALNNSLSGGSGNDRLSGLAGNDVLAGGFGDDILNGGLGNDQFRFATGAALATTIGNDYIADFESAIDKIVLSKATFTAITTAAAQPLTSFAVVDDDALVDSNANQIVYSTSSGGLFYNMNGSLSGDATKVVEFATLGNLAALAATDFIIAT